MTRCFRATTIERNREKLVISHYEKVPNVNTNERYIRLIRRYGYETPSLWSSIGQIANPFAPHYRLLDRKEYTSSLQTAYWGAVGKYLLGAMTQYGREAHRG